MPKINTLHNYFTSPKTVNKKDEKNESPKTSTGTPKRAHKEKALSKLKGKENTPTRKRSLEEVDDDDEFNDENVVKTPVSTTKRRRIIIPEDDEDVAKTSISTTKKRRIIIPEDDEDSEDEFKPDSSAELEESESEATEGCTETEPESQSDEESPIKKKRGKATAKGSKQLKNTKNKSSEKDSNIEAGSVRTANDSWPHLKYDFLQPDKIKDAEKRSKNHPEYDPKTLYVPKDFLEKQTPAMRQWWELKSKHFDTVMFFKVGKFYELYHMDSVVGFNELNLTFMRGENAHSGFPEIGYGRYAASLIERGYKVARIEQTESVEAMAQRCSKLARATKFDKVVRREICQISSIGTRVYTSLDVEASSYNSKYLLSLVEGNDNDSGEPKFGVCFLDSTIGEFNIGQFKDDRCHSRLLTLIAHYPPVHIIYERGNLSTKTLQILNGMLPAATKEPLQRGTQFWSATTTLKNLHEGDYFKKENSDEFEWPEGLHPYLNEGDTLGLTPADDKEMAIHALGGCVHILKEYLLEQQLLAQKRFKTYVPPDFVGNTATVNSRLPNCMVLDAVTINNLKLFGEGSLINTIDNCCTAFGKRMLREWMCRPSCRKTMILQRQKAVLELMDKNDTVQSARKILATIPDLERLLSKIHAQGNASRMKNHPDGRAIMFDGHIYSKRKINDFITTLDGFEKILEVCDLFKGFESDLINNCTQFESSETFNDLQRTLDYFKTAFDHKEAKEKGSIVPKKGVDPEYDDVIAKLANVKKDLDDYLNKQIKHFGVKVTYFGTDRKRFQIEIPESQTKKVGSNYELYSQRKGFKRYYTAETREFLARQISAEEQKNNVLKDLSRRVFAQFSEKYDMWSEAVYRIATVDVLISFAKYAQGTETCIPEIFDDMDSEEVFMEVRDGRHPCIVSDNFIPNDTLIATEGTASLVILTGPNMGGKSTLMRQVGLLTIMAQMGSLVPAASHRLTLTDRIFTRLGANDDILAGQSTFFVELSETATILQHATPFSFVLLDELGRGTSTYDGTAIAAAVVDSLTKLKCRTLFSTHYHSLVEDYKTNNSVTLAHMACMVEAEEEEEVSQETVTFLYKLSDGACPKSYGFNAARLAGVPSIITQRAHEIAKKMEREAYQRHLFTKICKAQSDSLNAVLDEMKQKSSLLTTN